jgi:hypothetical protein
MNIVNWPILFSALNKFCSIETNKGNLTNNCDFFEVRDSCQGRQLSLLTPGIKKPSYLTGDDDDDGDDLINCCQC